MFNQDFYPTPKEVIAQMTWDLDLKNKVVLEPSAGSGSTLVAAIETNRKAFGFEIDREFYPKAKEWIQKTIQRKKDIELYGYAKTEIDNEGINLFSY